jgi:hypothetical protein
MSNKTDSLYDIECVGSPPRLVRTGPLLPLYGDLDGIKRFNKLHRSWHYNPHVPHCRSCESVQNERCERTPGGCICDSACAHMECRILDYEFELEMIYVNIVSLICNGVIYVQGLFPCLGYDEEEEEKEMMRTKNIIRRSGSSNITAYYLVKYDERIYNVEHDLRLNTFVFY